MVYYLDDDNIIHPDLYKLMNIVNPTYLYTFNQMDRIKGKEIKMGKIDTAMFLSHYSMIKGIKWERKNYNADGVYIETLNSNNPGVHVYVNNDLSYYNYLIN